MVKLNIDSQLKEKSEALEESLIARDVERFLKEILMEQANLFLMGTDRTPESICQRLNSITWMPVEEKLTELEVKVREKLAGDLKTTQQQEAFDRQLKRILDEDWRPIFEKAAGLLPAVLGDIAELMEKNLKVRWEFQDWSVDFRVSYQSLYKKMLTQTLHYFAKIR